MNPKNYSHNLENHISSVSVGATCLYSRRQRTYVLSPCDNNKNAKRLKCIMLISSTNTWNLKQLKFVLDYDSRFILGQFVMATANSSYYSFHRPVNPCC